MRYEVKKAVFTPGHQDELIQEFRSEKQALDFIKKSKNKLYYLSSVDDITKEANDDIRRLKERDVTQRRAA